MTKEKKQFIGCEPGWPSLLTDRPRHPREDATASALLPNPGTRLDAEHTDVAGVAQRPSETNSGNREASRVVQRTPRSGASSIFLRMVSRRATDCGQGNDVATVASLLREAETIHGKYRTTAAGHHWSSWYAAYLVARHGGRLPEAAAEDAARHVEGDGQ